MGEGEAEAASRDVVAALTAKAIDAKELLDDGMRFVIARSTDRARSVRIHCLWFDGVDPAIMFERRSPAAFEAGRLGRLSTKEFLARQSYRGPVFSMTFYDEKRLMAEGSVGKTDEVTACAGAWLQGNRFDELAAAFSFINDAPGVLREVTRALDRSVRWEFIGAAPFNQLWVYGGGRACKLTVGAPRLRKTARSVAPESPEFRGPGVPSSGRHVTSGLSLTVEACRNGSTFGHCSTVSASLSCAKSVSTRYASGTASTTSVCSPTSRVGCGSRRYNHPPRSTKRQPLSPHAPEHAKHGRMQRAYVVLAIVAVHGCYDTPPNTCDQSVVGDVVDITSVLRQMGSQNGPFACPGGGSGTKETVGPVMWSGTFTFDACTAHDRVTADTLTLTGSVDVDLYDNLNDGYSDGSGMLAIDGNVGLCKAPVHEDCAFQWDSYNTNDDPTWFKRGTLCGRRFP